MSAEDWSVLSDWHNQWLEANAQQRAQLRRQFALEQPDLLAEADALAEASAGLQGYLETPALLLAARDLAGDVPLLAADTMLGPYRLGSLLARGGMGDVYGATDVRLQRHVALKVLTHTDPSDLLRVERFVQEARVTASLDHANVVRLYDVGVFEGRPYLVTEFLEGETLRARVGRGPLPPGDAQHIAGEIVAGLIAAHAAGLVHRDLKPENIFLTRAGPTKILDFGIAKLSENGTARAGLSTLTGILLGTAGYLAPEQVRGDTVDSRADLFALGSILFEMLTGQRAFAREHTIDALHAIVHDPPPDLLNDRADVSRTLGAIVIRLLEKAPADRFQTSADLAWALAQSARTPVDTPSRPRPSSVGETPSPSGQLRWAAMTGVRDIGDARNTSAPSVGSRLSTLSWAAAAAALVMVGAAGWWTAWQASRTVDRPLLRLEVDLGPQAVAGLTAAISADGTRLAFLVHSLNGTIQLATRLLDQPQAVLLAGTEGAQYPFFKPDGQWIGFFAGGKMKKVSVLGSAVVTLCNAPDGRGAAWGNDDHIIATLDSETGVGLSRIPDQGGTPEAITNPAGTGEATHRWPQILPGGQDVLFTGHKRASTYDDATIEVLSLRTSQVKVVQRGGYFGRYLATSTGRGYLVYIHDRTLFGVRFDLNRMETRSAPTVLQDNVAGSSSTASGQFDFSLNGTFVYSSGQPSSGIWTMAWLDSVGATAPLLAAPGLYYDPRLSPDGQRLAFSNGTDIEIYDWGRGTLERLNFPAQAINFIPVWAPDGRHIVFQSQGTGGWSLQWIRADGARETQLLWESQNRPAPYSMSPDGKRLAFSEQHSDTGYDIWTLPLDTSDPDHPKPGNPELFLRTPFDERNPAFSPDGRWIAYQSSESGRDEVYVQAFPSGAASGSVKSTISSGGGQFPMWSRDGRELFYEGLDNRIMTAAYTARGDSFAADKPRPWASTRPLNIGPKIGNLDQAPDGKRFVIALAPQVEFGGEPKGSVHVTFLLNFVDEMRRRIPVGK